MKKSKIIGIIVLVALVATMAVTYVSFSEKTVEGQKNITIEVVMADETNTVYEVATDGEYLIDAMQAAEGLTFDGEDGPYGMSVSHVNGVRADYTLDGAYWGFYVNNEYCNYGISEQPIEDGDEFSIVYTVAP